MQDKEMQSAFRKKRVRIIKYLLVILTITFLVLPTILCVVLFAKIDRLNQRLNEVSSVVDQYMSRQTDTVNEPLEEVGSQGFIVIPGSSDKDVSTPLKEEEQPEEKSATLRKVYLTFDDGPSSHTNEILDILDTYGVKATFFVIGKEGEDAQNAYKRIVEDGHTLGMHSYSHVYKSIYASVEDYAADLTKLQEYLYDITGVWSRFVRFPGGSSNTVSKIGMETFIQYVKDQGLTYFDWNVSSKDASNPSPKAEDIIKNCMNDIEKHQTVVILMHDTAGKKSTVEALPGLIEQIQALDNTEILPISDDTEPVQHITISENETED